MAVSCGGFGGSGFNQAVSIQVFRSGLIFGSRVDSRPSTVQQVRVRISQPRSTSVSVHPGLAQLGQTGQTRDVDSDDASNLVGLPRNALNINTCCIVLYFQTRCILFPNLVLNQYY
ncbi:hypothetical protein Hanom_Chr02g00152241 [Helianthus anomalus]